MGLKIFKRRKIPLQNSKKSDRVYPTGLRTVMKHKFLLNSYNSQNIDVIMIQMQDIHCKWGISRRAIDIKIPVILGLSQTGDSWRVVNGTCLYQFPNFMGSDGGYITWNKTALDRLHQTATIATTATVQNQPPHLVYHSMSRKIIKYNSYTHLSRFMLCH